MDLLDRVAGPGLDLLVRVDDVLARAGAPADHPVWRLIQRAGALPAAAFTQVAAVSAADLETTATHLDAARAEIRRSVESVPAYLDSRGAAADGFRARWSALGPQIVGPQIADDGLAGRLAATSAALDRVATWIADARHRVAGEMGACLGSTEAVLVRSIGGVPGPDEIRAAADLGACVLAAVIDAVDEGWQRISEWSELAHRAPVSTHVGSALPVANHIDLR